MEVQRIIGIVLVQNEDIFLEKVLQNIEHFCDHIIIADHNSSDDTAAVAQKFCLEKQYCVYHRINHPRQSHDLIKKYAGQNVWVFAVDGDEVYEPEKLAEFRRCLLAGMYDDRWMLFGNVVNCIDISIDKKTASGYMAPPCRSMTKLYNFNAIVSWDGDCSERLHGGTVVFKPDYDRDKIYFLYKEIPWEESIFRCLHLCFFPRSSKDKQSGGQLLMRKNIADGMSENIFQRFMFRLFKTFGFHGASPLKREKYMRGEVREVDIRSFML